MSLNSEEILVGWGNKTFSEMPLKGYSFFFNDFFLQNRNPWLQYEFQQVISLSELLSQLKNFSSFDKKKVKWNRPNRNFFFSAYDNLQENYFNTGVLKKGVPYTFQTCCESLSKNQLAHSLISLLEHASHLSIYPYGFWDSSHGLLGGTPEILFKNNSANSHIIETVACAGTISSKIEGVEFLSDQKQRQEHQLVIDGIVNAFEDLGEIKIGETTAVKYSHLMHLFTKIALITKNLIPFNRLVDLLHPTPALGAYPKNEGKKWLEEMNFKKKRKYFGSPVGYYDLIKQQGACYVAIRNMQWDDKSIFLTAGCGVIEQSIKEKEWEEILIKLKAIRKLLAL